jgi:biotin carboxylase
MSRVLLILPSQTYRAADFVDAARVLGAEVVVASDIRQAMAEQMGPRALKLDLDDASKAAGQIVEHAQHVPLDAVIAVDDRGVLAASLAAKSLGLVHNMPEAVAATRDKSRMRRVFEHAQLPQPGFRVVQAGDDVLATANELGFPVVVKPVALSASRGVIRVDDPRGLRETVRRVRAILAEAREDPLGPLLVERYVPGAEVALEGLLRRGELDVLAIFDKPDPLEGPYFEETIYVTPSRLPQNVQDRIALLVADAAAALRLREGPIHAEVRVDGEQLWMLELASRTIGGLCSRTLRFGLGMSLEELVLRHALKRPIGRLSRERDATGVMMLPIPKAGVLREVRGLEEARAVEGVFGVEITVPRGHQVRPLPEGDRYLGFVFARGARPQDVEHSLREAHSRLDVTIG